MELTALPQRENDSLRRGGLSKTLTDYNAADGIVPGQMSPSCEEGCAVVA